MKRRILIFFIWASFFLVAGCIPEVIYIPDGQAVRLREMVPDVAVWVITKDGEVMPGKMDLPEGWYCLPDTGE